MKYLVFIIGLLVSVILFAPEEGRTEMTDIFIANNEALMKTQDTSDTQRKFEVLSNELKSSTCLTPRRAFQTANNSFDIRIWKNMEKSLQCMRRRGENQLHKVSQHTSSCQTVLISTLLCRMGQYVYSLRKLII